MITLVCSWGDIVIVGLVVAAVVQGLFEGMKAYRKEDGKLLLFRPEQNALRMRDGAERLCMPFPSVEQFIDAVKQTVLANERWVTDFS